LIVSHAPQTPYFYSNSQTQSWAGLYYLVEYYHGDYIDFYNIQYYNNGDYTTENTIFVTDESPDWCAAVLQLANTGFTYTTTLTTQTIKIPVHKIVVGKATDANFPGNNESNWNSLTGFVNDQKISTYSTLREWYNTGGIMVWVYRTDTQPPPTINSYVLTYFFNVTNSIS
jgi:chitinase